MDNMDGCNLAFHDVEDSFSLQKQKGCLNPAEDISVATVSKTIQFQGARRHTRHGTSDYKHPSHLRQEKSGVEAGRV